MDRSEDVRPCHIKLRILFLQGLCKYKFRKVVSWFSLRQDASETLLKKWGHRSIFVKKKWSGKVKKIHLLLWWSGIMAQIIRFFFLFGGGQNDLILFINYI